MMGSTAVASRIDRRPTRPTRPEMNNIARSSWISRICWLLVAVGTCLWILGVFVKVDIASSRGQVSLALGHIHVSHFAMPRNLPTTGVSIHRQGSIIEAARQSFRSQQFFHRYATGGLICFPVYSIILMGLICRMFIWLRSPVRVSYSACAICGYCLTGNTSGVCPECGSKLGETSRVGRSHDPPIRG